MQNIDKALAEIDRTAQYRELQEMQLQQTIDEENGSGSLYSIVQYLKGCGWTNEDIIQAIQKSAETICKKIDKEKARA
jgi:CHASE3 domain sensor protein